MKKIYIEERSCRGMYCGNCGVELPPDCRFCPNCGCEVEKDDMPIATIDESKKSDFFTERAAPVKEIEKVEVPRANNQSGSLTGLILAGAVLIIIIIIMVSTVGKSNHFSIEGKWKNVGDTTYGQMQSGAVVIFDGQNCNVVSPSDTYAFYKDGQYYTLDCTTMIFSETLSFSVDVEDNDNIIIYTGAGDIELTRID